MKLYERGGEEIGSHGIMVIIVCIRQDLDGGYYVRRLSMSTICGKPSEEEQKMIVIKTSMYTTLHDERCKLWLTRASPR